MTEDPFLALQRELNFWASGGVPYRIEAAGLQAILESCRASGVRLVLSSTSQGCGLRIHRDPRAGTTTPR